MKLRELKRGPGHAWPPMFGGAYRAGDRFPVGEVGVLKSVENSKMFSGLSLEIEYEGRTWSGLMQWTAKSHPGTRSATSYAATLGRISASFVTSI